MGPYAACVLRRPPGAYVRIRQCAPMRSTTHARRTGAADPFITRLGPPSLRFGSGPSFPPGHSACDPRLIPVRFRIVSAALGLLRIVLAAPGWFAGSTRRTRRTLTIDHGSRVLVRPERHFL